jgi:hypothetical protein
MVASEPLPTCRRKAAVFGALGLATLVFAWGLHVSGVVVDDWLLGVVTGLGAGGLGAAPQHWWMPVKSEAGPQAQIARYHREVVPAMAGHVLAVLAWKRTLHLFEATWLRVLLAVLPALMVLGVMRAFVRYVRDSDELQRRIELEAGAIAGLLVSAGFLAAGFLQAADLIAIPAKVTMLWVFPMLCFTYGITKVVIARRYL